MLEKTILIISEILGNLRSFEIKISRKESRDHEHGNFWVLKLKIFDFFQISMSGASGDVIFKH